MDFFLVSRSIHAIIKTYAKNFFHIQRRNHDTRTYH